MALNEKQQQAYDTVLAPDADRIIILKGQAGSGKTFTVSEIIKAYPGDVAITACTHRAKQVISNMAEDTAYTTQARMCFIMARNGRTQYLTPNPSKPVEPCGLLIVEEVSMLPLTIYDSIMKHLELGTIQKVLFLGDAIQLPPVGAGVDIESIPGTHIELTEQMRQAPCPTLLNYLDGFRNAIATEDTQFVMNTALPETITFTDDHTAFCRAYSKAEGSKRIIAFTNSTVNTYNTHIHGVEGTFQAGDEVIINKPLGRCQNGDTVLIKEVVDLGNYLQIRVVADGEPIITRYYKTKQALESYLNDSKSNSEYWAKFDRCMDYKHVYACTTFKSQGATIDHVFVDLTDIYSQHVKKPTKWNNYAKPISFELFLRHAYVAITRMSKSATCFIGGNRTYRGFKGR